MRCSHWLVACFISGIWAVAPEMHAQSSPTSPAKPPAPLPKLLDCSIGPVTKDCNIVLLTGQDSVQFSVGINPAVLHPSADSVPVTISASRCCVRAQQVLPDANGFVSVMWNAAQKPDSNVYIRFLMRNTAGQLMRDSVELLKPAAPPPPVAVFTTPYTGTVPRYVWVRGDHIPVAIPISLDASGTPGSGPFPRERCEKVRAVFVALMGGDASPDTVRALWHPKRTRTGWHATQGQCLVATRWKLADDAGEQQMDVVVGGDSGIARSRFSVTAFAREIPRLTGGFGYFADLRQDREVTCGEARTHSRCAGKPDSSNVTIQFRDGTAAPYFALEFPVFLSYRVSEGASVGKYLSEHLRIVFGSTFTRPADNAFFGLALLPLASGASEASPFQLSAGIGGHGLRTWYAGMSLDASTIVAPVLSAIGIAK